MRESPYTVFMNKKLLNQIFDVLGDNGYHSYVHNLKADTDRQTTEAAATAIVAKLRAIVVTPDVSVKEAEQAAKSQQGTPTD